MEIYFIFIVFFLLKDVVFSDQTPTLTSEINTEAQDQILIYDQNIFSLIELVIDDLEAVIENEEHICHLAEVLKKRNIFDEIDRRECVDIFELLKARYFTVKPIFSSINEECFEITELTLKVVEELNFIIQRKREFNSLLLEKIDYLIKNRFRYGLLIFFEEFRKMISVSTDKTIRFIRFCLYIRNKFDRIY